MAYEDVAVVIPCHNEAATVESVVKGFAEALPGAHIVVADNASTDGTADLARAAGATVISERRPGKGWAMRRLFADVDAQIFVMVDGDATYDPTNASELVSLVRSGSADMVTGARMTAVDAGAAYRRGHRLGNAVLTWIFTKLFDLAITDTLSGYRAFSRRFVKSFSTTSTGFEIEAELNAHAAFLGVPVAEIPTRYSQRPEGSVSKLSTYRDGIRILRRNLLLFRDARPLLAFLLLSAPWWFLAALLVGVPTVEYLSTGIVTRFPSLIAGMGALVVALLLWVTGLILQRVAKIRRDVARLTYLGIPGPSWTQSPLFDGAFRKEG